ncbi:MAG: glycosyltransferase family 39 protein [Candidatus Omnitrophica bacterium]|nr:glycosyltransferase family 39 protein [Candidatus Omnitrophota bacterium]
MTVPFNDVLEYDWDEGGNLMKASLYSKGYSLYEEIWSDQPPLLTLILSTWFNLFGPSAYKGRLLILILSAILLWAFHQTIKNRWGNLCAFMAVLFLVSSAMYLQLSVSVMIGLPALAFAMLSIYCVSVYGKSQSNRVLFLSGIFMALSLQTKFFTIFLVPLIALEIIRIKWSGLKSEGQKKHLVFPVLAWLGIVLLAYFCIALAFLKNFDHLTQELIQPHTAAKTLFGKFNALPGMISQDYDIAIFALIGAVLFVAQKKWHAVFPFLWVISASAILLTHNPVWNHHYLLISIPMAWLAGISFGELFRIGVQQGWSLKHKIRDIIYMIYRLSAIAVMIVPIAILPGKFKKAHKDLTNKPSIRNNQVIELLLKYKQDTRWVVTDSQLLPFHAGLLVPPELVSTTLKRKLTGDLTPGYFLEVLKKYKPEQVLLRRYGYYDRKIMPYIEKNYFKVHHHKDTRLYIRKDIKK